jgi:hypothetical protein
MTRGGNHVNRQLTIDDIADLRAYERERAEFKAEVIALKKRRRVPVGLFVTLLFENRQTIRFQIQEMARVEKIISDEGIAAELAAYNPLIPEPGHLSATLFLELTTEEQLREWLPKLVGIERSIELRIGDGDDRIVVPCEPESTHEAMLTREETTASVHYIGFTLTDEQIERFASSPVAVAVAHPDYREETVLTDATVAELLADLRP